MVLLQRKLKFSKIHHFPGVGGIQHLQGVQFYPGGGGVQMLISIETHITCVFPGGGEGGLDLLSPLLICT